MPYSCETMPTAFGVAMAALSVSRLDGWGFPRWNGGTSKATVPAPRQVAGSVSEADSITAYCVMRSPSRSTRVQPWRWTLRT